MSRLLKIVSDGGFKINSVCDVPGWVDRSSLLVEAGTLLYFGNDNLLEPERVGGKKKNLSTLYDTSTSLSFKILLASVNSTVHQHFTSQYSSKSRHNQTWVILNAVLVNSWLPSIRDGYPFRGPSYFENGPHLLGKHNKLCIIMH